LFLSVVGCGAVTGPNGLLSGAGGGGAGGAAGRGAFDVTGFGARGDDDADDTVAFRHALEAVRQLGGGTVVVPRGTYRVGPLDLCSNLALRIDPAATLVFHDDPALYPLVDTRWDGVMRPARRPLLWADNCVNLTIFGGGTIDGSGARWWEPVLAMREPRRESPSRARSTTDGAGRAAIVSPPTRADRPATAASPGAATRPATTRSATAPATTSPSPRAGRGSPAPAPQTLADAALIPQPWETDERLRRPPLLQLRNCSNVRVEGLTLQDAPHCTVHVLFSAGVTLRNVRLLARADAPGADGVNVDSSREVNIDRCHADVGDSDAFALRSGRDEDGRRMRRPTENVTVRNSTVARALAGVAIGSEMSGGVRNVRFIDCRFDGTDVGLLIKTQRGRGGAVEGVTAQRLTMDGVAIPFEITTRHRESDPEPVSERTPRIADVRVTGLRARGATRAGIIDGLEESPVRGLDFRELDIAARYGITCTWAAGVSFRDAIISTDFGPALIRSNTSDVRLDRWRETTPEAATRASEDAQGPVR
jgi:polygalacturonase